MMKWRCVLIRRWLPEYPDGELSSFRHRRLEAHLQVCPGCRKELAELQEVVEAFKQQPVPDPEPGFWKEFNRDLHLKLAQVNQAPAPEAKRIKWPYLVGAPALAVLLVFLSSYLVKLHQPGKAPQLAEQQKLDEPLRAAKPRPAAPAHKVGLGEALDVAKPQQPAAAYEVGRFRDAEGEQTLMIQKASPPHPANHTVAPEQVIYAGIDDGFWHEEEFPSWDVDAVIADLSHQERKALAEKLSTRR